MLSYVLGLCQGFVAGLVVFALLYVFWFARDG